MLADARTCPICLLPTKPKTNFAGTFSQEQISCQSCMTPAEPKTNSAGTFSKHHQGHVQRDHQESLRLDRHLWG